MKKYLIPLLVLVLLLVSVTTVSANLHWVSTRNRPDDSITDFNYQGICTFVVNPDNPDGCPTNWSFAGNGNALVCLYTGTSSSIYYKEKGKLSLFNPVQDGEWRCDVKGTKACVDWDWRNPRKCAGWVHLFNEIILTKEITTP